MTTEFEKVLRLRFPDNDIRSDQCDTIRVISSTVAAGCRTDGIRFSATVVSLLADELDYEDEVIAEIDEPTAQLLAERLAEYF
ncbi:MAG: hypothetical protein GY854_12375 [Deltaproteobacteria bacterium]|nr:hypothetical protein [Deltaproteobacteria bacterium]